MSPLVPLPPREEDGGPESTTFLDPRLARERVEERWALRAAQWRARLLAEAVFGGDVRVSLTGARSGGPFRGLLHLEVPFRDLEGHRACEARFTAWAGRDPLLSRSPFVYVFVPRPEPAAASGGGPG